MPTTLPRFAGLSSQMLNVGILMTYSPHHTACETGHLTAYHRTSSLQGTDAIVRVHSPPTRFLVTAACVPRGPSCSLLTRGVARIGMHPALRAVPNCVWPWRLPNLRNFVLRLSESVLIIFLLRSAGLRPALLYRLARSPILV